MVKISFLTGLLLRTIRSVTKRKHEFCLITNCFFFFVFFIFNIVNFKDQLMHFKQIKTHTEKGH